MTQIRIQVMFTINNYSDALYYSLAEWQSVTPEQIEQAKQDRYDAWIAAINAASTEESTEEQV